ncbi:MAG TPA: superoxide dismutase family protein [Burkholderiales bacterium]|nr:superoxide dismutase family protein [Burkholderiales bacterium]
MRSFWILACGCALLAACSGASNLFAKKQSATAILAPTKGNAVSGTVNFTQKGDVVLVEAKINGLKPNGSSGIHIHEKGNCSAADASSAGGHFNPTGSRHGGPTGAARHGGDLGNLKADANGYAQLSEEIGGISLGTDPASIIGRAVIVHAGTDDMKSQPAGNSGARVACGLISKNPDKFF